MGPGYKTDLADIIRKSGLTVHEVAGWKTRGHGPMGKVQGTMCHHTAGPAKGNLPSLNVVTSGRSGLAGPLSNVMLARDGSVWVIAAGRSYHAGLADRPIPGITSGNTNTIGIEAESTGYGDWTASQISAYPRLVAALSKGYQHPVSTIVDHQQWAPTRKIDLGKWPGGIAGMRAKASAILLDAKPAPPAPGVVEKVITVVTGKLLVDGKFGPATISKFERHLGITQDGQWDYAAKVAMQRWLRVTADGIVGPVTVRALQQRIGATADGVWGAATTAALQRFLNTGSAPPVKPVAKPPVKPPVKPVAKPPVKPPVKPVAKPPIPVPRLVLDGQFGPATIRALQRVIRVTPDGRWGPVSKRALQRRLSVAQDGIVGPATIRALQRRIGATADGVWGKGTTLALQKALNAGKF